MQAHADPQALLEPEALEHPHPFFRSLRERAPLHAVGESRVHLVTRWSTIEEVLGREADFSANLTGVLMRNPSGQVVAFELPSTGATNVIATADEPDHGVDRSVLQPSLGASRMAPLEPALRSWTDAALEGFLAAGGGNFAREVAEIVPANAILHLLGLPDEDLERVRPWAMMGGDMLAGALDEARMTMLRDQTAQMAEYLSAHLLGSLDTIESDRKGPLARALVRGIEAGQLDLPRAVGIAIVLFGAGGESTASLIGSAARLLSLNPDLADRLRADPLRIPRFIEETVRLESPFKGHYRAVRRPCTLAGQALGPGDRLFLLWISANRDPEIFEGPDDLDLERRYPKQHMGFGRGAHFCIGAHLARLEARVVLEELLSRTKHLEPIPEEPPRHVPSLFVRRLESLPLAVGR
jgi:cytochrome P450